MPTVLRVNGFRFMVYGPPREHPPPHVHVGFGATGLVVIRLPIGTLPARVWAVYGMKDGDVATAFRLAEHHHELLLRAWRSVHGQKAE